MKTLICVFFIAMLAMPVLAQPGTFGEPANAWLSKYPIKSRPLSHAEQADLGLSVKKLEKAIVVQNHFRNLGKDGRGRFVLETLHAGTLVLEDRYGIIRYKADCGNRIVEVMPCPQCPATATTGKDATKNTFAQPGTWSRFWDNAGKAWDSMWGGLGSLLGFLLPLLLLLAVSGLVAYAIARIMEDRARERWIGQNPQPPLPIPPAQPVAPATPPVQPPPPGRPFVPSPTQPATGRGHGRFRFEMSDKGNIYGNMNGYRNLVVKENEDGTLIINADRV